MEPKPQYYKPLPVMDELRYAAFEYLLFNPGSKFDDWMQGMLEQYPTEVVDALGVNPETVYAELSDLWNSDYADPQTGIKQKFSEWALAFANEYAIGIYFRLVKAYDSLRPLGFA